VTLASADVEAADGALSKLWEYLHHQGHGVAVGALAVPFLIRIVSAGSPRHRADTVLLVAEIGRCEHFGDGTREGLLRIAEDPFMSDGTTHCPVNWTIQAARDAVAGDVHLLFPLLSHADPDVRSATAFVLSVSAGETPRISSALHVRLTVEDNPVVRASLILGLAQLGREHRGESTATWTKGLWSDSDHPREIRVSAGLAWLCLVNDAVPEEHRTLLTDASTDRLNELFQQVAWIRPVDFINGQGLRRCIDQMLTPGADDGDPWA
jgi:hypothetical protein